MWVSNMPRSGLLVIALLGVTRDSATAARARCADLSPLDPPAPHDARETRPDFFVRVMCSTRRRDLMIFRDRYTRGRLNGRRGAERIMGMARELRAYGTWRDDRTGLLAGHEVRAGEVPAAGAARHPDHEVGA